MIIGLHGRMRAGKNEAARRIAAFSPLPVVEVSFAAKLKQSAAALLGVDVADLEWLKNDPTAEVLLTWHERELPQTVRSFLQRYGTEAHRDVFGEDFWLDAALPVGRDHSDALYVVTDVRFPNEIARVRELSGVVALIVGPNEDAGNAHSSEELHHDDVDLLIDNAVRDDGFANLDRQLRSLVRYLIARQAA